MARGRDVRGAAVLLVALQALRRLLLLDRLALFLDVRLGRRVLGHDRTSLKRLGGRTTSWSTDRGVRAIETEIRTAADLTPFQLPRGLRNHADAAPRSDYAVVYARTHEVLGIRL